MIRAGAATREALLRDPGRVVLYDIAGRASTAGELVSRVDQLAGAILESGRATEPIGLWYRNSLAALEAFLAVEWVGGTRIAVDPNAQPAEARATFEAANAGLILVDAAHAALMRDLATIHDNDTPWFGKACWPSLDVPPTKTLNLYPRAVNNGKLFAIPFSYGNWTAIMQTNVALYQAGAFGEWQEDNECFLAAQQIMHATSFVGTFPFLLMGRPQVLVDDFVGERVVDAIERHRVTSTMLVPQMLLRLVASAEARPAAVSSLRHVLYGGGPVHADDIRRALRCLGPSLSQVYGRMEGGWPISVLGIDAHRAILDGDDRIAQSCGRPIQQVAIRLRPVAGFALDSGELCVAGAMTVAEYAGADGYCSLGDIMERDAQGYLFYRGRLDRMINTGYHIYPAEIEEIIAGVAGVAQARVVGEPSREWGETVVAYVVATDPPSAVGLLERLKRELLARLAHYKIPREFRLVDALPELP